MEKEGVCLRDIFLSFSRGYLWFDFINLFKVILYFFLLKDILRVNFEVEWIKGIEIRFWKSDIRWRNNKRIVRYWIDVVN